MKSLGKIMEELGLDPINIERIVVIDVRDRTELGSKKATNSDPSIEKGTIRRGPGRPKKVVPDPVPLSLVSSSKNDPKLGGNGLGRDIYPLPFPLSKRPIPAVKRNKLPLGSITIEEAKKKYSNKTVFRISRMNDNGLLRLRYEGKVYLTPAGQEAAQRINDENQ